MAIERVGWALDAVGERLEPGDWILTGSLVHAPVAPGDEVVARIEGLGEVAVPISGGSSGGG